MPRQIEQSTLESISGKAQLSATSDLLNNTLETMSHRAKMREAQQLSELRSTQIQTANQQYAEMMQGAYARAAQQEILNQQVDHALKRVDKDLQMQDELKDISLSKERVAGIEAGFDQLLRSPDNSSFQAQLDALEGTMPKSTLNQLKNINYDTPEGRERATQLGVRNLEYLRQVGIASAKAGAGGAGGILGTASGEQIQRYLDGSGMSPDEADIVSTTIVQTAHGLDELGVRITGGALAQEVTRLYNEEHDKFVIDDPSWTSFDDLDHNALVKQAAQNLVYGQQKELAAGAGGTSESAQYAQAAGVEPARWAELRGNAAFKHLSNEELVAEVQKWKFAK